MLTFIRRIQISMCIAAAAATAWSHDQSLGGCGRKKRDDVLPREKDTRETTFENKIQTFIFIIWARANARPVSIIYYQVSCAVLALALTYFKTILFFIVVLWKIQSAFETSKLS